MPGHPPLKLHVGWTPHPTPRPPPTIRPPPPRPPLLSGPGAQVVLKATGAPPFGAWGTVIGIYEAAAELLMDEEFPGGAGGVAAGQLLGC